MGLWNLFPVKRVISMINNIDVTLRDGGYQNNFSFPVDYAIKHVRALVGSGVEWIEIGYRNGSFKPIVDIGLTGMSPDNYIQAIHDAVPEAKLVVIAHPHNITRQDIIRLRECGVALLRLCIKTDNPQPALELCEVAKENGLRVSMNFTRASQINAKTLVDVALQCENAGADIICIADSNGSLRPEQTARLVNLLKCATPLEVGFHAHDNLGLAMANSIEAVKAGATFIDSSLTGMGKGAGNLAMEIWLSLCNFNEGKERYHTEWIFNQVHQLVSKEFYNASYRSVVDMILGVKNLSVENRKMVEESLTTESQRVFSAIENVITGTAA
ncbi:3-hydroxy-3-methylglutaryl-CoA lyase [Enterobacter asburiae]